MVSYLQAQVTQNESGVATEKTLRAKAEVELADAKSKAAKAEKQRVRRKQKRKTQKRKKRRLLQQVTAVTADTADTVDTTGQVFTGVLGAKARVKEGVHKSSKVAGPFRDAVVDLMIEQNYPGGTIFAAMQTIFRALGLTPADSVSSTEKTSTQCLMERATILLDDQVRRMAEKNRPGMPALHIRTKHWTKATAQLWQDMYGTAQENWDISVSGAIAEWMDKIDYKPADLPDPTDIDVGLFATTKDELVAALCAIMFCGVDGTTHGRCVRNPVWLAGCGSSSNAHCAHVTGTTARS